MIPRNLGCLFKDTARRFPDKKAYVFKENQKVLSLTWAEAAAKVDRFASSMLARGLRHGDRIAILSENRPEWALVDMAAQMIGAVVVPIYTSLTPAEIQYILQDSGASMAAVSTKALFKKIAAVQKSLPLLQSVMGFEPDLALSRDEITVPLVLPKEWEASALQKADLEKGLESVGTEEAASIIYTSGTTGVPKGVMLTHSNFIHNVTACRKAFHMNEGDVHLSFLPLSHVFERTVGHYLMIAIGATIAYAESLDAVRQDILEVRPTFLLGVPRFFEKIKEHVLDTVHRASSVKKGIFFWAKDIGERRRRALPNQEALGALFKMEVYLADQLAYKKFKNRLGGRLRFCISGGAPLAKEVAEFFYDLGVLIYEGYGLTETSPVITVNREDKFKFGTVGLPLEGVEVRISEEGEIMTKSPSVMKGYYNKAEETKAVLKDGWFYTGDLGAFDKEGFLVITGRKKELIVTSGGKKVAPRPIEELVETDPWIVRCVLFGEGRRFITALVVPRKEKLIEYAREVKIAYDSYKNLLKNPLIYTELDRRIQALTKDLASFERIKYFAALENDFTQEFNELTPTLKVKREVVFSRYKDELLPLYEKEK